VFLPGNFFPGKIKIGVMKIPGKFKSISREKLLKIYPKIIFLFNFLLKVLLTARGLTSTIDTGLT